MYPQSRPELHAEEVAYGDLALLVVGFLGRLFGEDGKQELIEREQLLIHRHTGQHRGDGLGYRSQIVERVDVGRIEISVEDGVPMTDHQQAVNAKLLLYDMVDRVRQELRIEPCDSGDAVRHFAVG